MIFLASWIRWIMWKSKRYARLCEIRWIMLDLLNRANFLVLRPLHMRKLAPRGGHLDLS
jgi:hypothetical protein